MEWARTRPDSMLGLVLSSSTACFVQRPDWPHAMAATTLAQFGDEFAASYPRTLLRFLTLQARGSEQGRAASRNCTTTCSTAASPHQPHCVPRSVCLRSPTCAMLYTPSPCRRSFWAAIAIHVPSAALRWLADALPNATLDIVADAAHTRFAYIPTLRDGTRPVCDDN